MRETSVVAARASWHLAWGRIDTIATACWQDEGIAFFPPPDFDASQPSEPPIPLAFSPSERFAIAGEVWLGDRPTLCQRLAPHAPSPPAPSPPSDLQLVALAWELWGESTLENLVGAFALAVWDCERQELRLARDRVGARTLYYTSEGPTRWVAPNLRSLAPFHPKEIDFVALRDYLCCAFVPGDRTLWRQVRELRPGTVLRFPDQRMRPYWQLQEQIVGAERSLAWHGDRLRELLEVAVRERLPPDEPVGVFLSGGLDSSSVTALAGKFHTAPIRTYSIHFGKECPNELEFSSAVARHCGTEHHILEISFREMWERLPETMAWLDDPIGDPLTVPNLLLGRLASESVRVVLNGEGGDPCFGGPKNQPMLLERLYGSLTQQDPLQAYLRSFKKCALHLPQLLAPEIWAAVCDEPYVFSEDLASTASYLNRLMALNIKFKGADHILTKVSNLTRASGLQGRSPLFDPRIVEFSMQVPPAYKLSGTQEKAVLKQAVADLLPEAIVHRPKSGMMVPVQLGFHKYWRRKARSLLLNRRAAIAPFLNRDLIRDWLNYRGDSWKRYGIKLWLLSSLEIWLQVHRK